MKTRFDARNELTVLGLGGIDKMKLNTKADDEDNEYILSYLPKIQQETFTRSRIPALCGAHVQSVVASHSYLNNRNTKYQQNDESDPEHLMLRLRSTEQNTQSSVLRTVRLSATGKSPSEPVWTIASIATPPFRRYTPTVRRRSTIIPIWASCAGDFSEQSITPP